MVDSTTLRSQLLSSRGLSILAALIADLAGGQQLNDFALPVTDHVTVSLFILIISYVATASAVPLAWLRSWRTARGRACPLNTTSAVASAAVTTMVNAAAMTTSR